MYLREVFLIIRRSAGHSKWQNIKHTKATKDLQRSQVFTKLCQNIKVSIQENGNNPNPLTNAQLAQAVENAKRNDMPVSTIQSCIKATQVDKEGAQPYRFSIRGPKGSILLVTTLTSKLNKTKHELQYILKKSGGMMSDQSLDGNFVKKGVIIALPPTGIENVAETSVEHAIEAGAEEVSPFDDNKKKLEFFCEMAQLHKVKSKLEELQYKVEDSKVTLIPKLKVSLNEDEMEFMSKIIQKLEEHQEVVNICDNIE